MLVTCRQMQEMEAQAFASGLSASELMDQAGLGIAQIIKQSFPRPGTLVLYLGKGNNAGDALVAAKQLESEGWRIWIRASEDVEDMKPLPRAHWRSLSHAETLTEAPLPTAQPPMVLLDGLVGIGVTGPLRSRLSDLALEMNRLRVESGAYTVAMDIPSGLDGDAGIPEEDCVIADITATVGAVKLGLVADSAVRHVGRLAVVHLPQLTRFAPESADSSRVLTPPLLQTWLPRRSFDTHKGQAGRVAILAGSRGYLGAAQLACHAALRAGTGLVTLWVKPDAYDILAQRVSPEVMVRAISDYRDILSERFDALAIGPGLGLAHQEEYLTVIRETTAPAVIDADALTALSQNQAVLEEARGPRLLTPHPGEMARLMPEGGILSRADQAETWARTHPKHTLLLKGARTVITEFGRDTLFNTTGHPGMATGGMGDVLTGVCAALIGQGLSNYQSAGVGAWLCGRAAELHAVESSPESTLPTDVILNLGHAWRELTSGAAF